MKARARDLVANPYVVSASRLALGGIFVAASVGKLQHQALFTDTVISYGMLPHGLAEMYGTVTPWVELLLGCCLVLGVFSTFAAAVSIPLIDSFIIAGIYALFRPAGDICGCFGELVSLSHLQAVLVDAAMLLIAWQILLYRDRAESLGLGALLSRFSFGAGRLKRYSIQFAALAVVVVLPASLVGDTANSPDIWMNEGPQVLLFWDGCADCFESELQIIDVLEQEYGDRIAFVRVNYLEDPEPAEKFGVENSFVVLLITGGTDDGGYVVHQRFEGTIDEEMLRDCFDRVLSS